MLGPAMPLDGSSAPAVPNRTSSSFSPGSSEPFSFLSLLAQPGALLRCLPHLPRPVALFVYKVARFRIGDQSRRNAVLPLAGLGQVKETSHQPQMMFTACHTTVTFQTDGETWREQKEKKAAMMVGILIGVFVLCWIPFFVTELITLLCSCTIAPVWKSIFLWLG